MPFISFRELKIWSTGMEILTDIYLHTDAFPRKEMFGLVSQMRRAAVSISSNIAEGYGRNSKKEFHRFLNISLGSLAELETQVEASFRLGFLNLSQRNLLANKLMFEGKMIKKFISSLSI